MAAKKTPSLAEHHRAHLEPRWRKAPFVLRITEWKGSPIPVLVLKERRSHAGESVDTTASSGADAGPKGKLAERGHVSGDNLRRCLPVLRNIVASVQDESGVPLEIQRYLTQDGLRLRVNLPLDEESGAKLALIFRLQERVADQDRVELMARRVERFTREEAAYWLSRMTSFSPDARRWAVAGMRLMLGGQANDSGVERMLERLRA
ncbi:DUF7680 family protein [Candidatus Thiodictyon syntrophicum]|uniref:DUF7680 domain-containing protein n=1 Tax=Candidatus Thiodictyon syntrophicum TaxID=1166950 RepID=A0A2K8U8E2_9GAMM|nr:hypothetical protein [Candidatus Thiodictyon syntrophicum]AUB81862.1 hypothetical protein THSYN_13415 [Candidatus Thiodictyon syntrophicum]